MGYDRFDAADIRGFSNYWGEHSDLTREQAMTGYVSQKDRKAADIQWQYEGAEVASKLGEATEAELMRAYNRQIGQMRGRLGFAASSGAGGAGYWDSAKIALEGKAMGQLGQARTASEKIEAQMHANYLDREDAQRHQVFMQEEQAKYRLAELERQAELNDPSWWEDFMGVVGVAVAIGGAFFTGGASLMAMPAEIPQPAVTASMIPTGW